MHLLIIRTLERSHTLECITIKGIGLLFKVKGKEERWFSADS